MYILNELCSRGHYYNRHVSLLCDFAIYIHLAKKHSFYFILYFTQLCYFSFSVLFNFFVQSVTFISNNFQFKIDFFIEFI